MANKKKTWDFDIRQGYDYNATLTYYQVDGVTPVDLTNYTVQMQGRYRHLDTSAIIDLQNNNGISISDAPNGQVALTIDNTITLALKGDTYVLYDIMLTDGSGNNIELTHGTIHIIASLIK